MRSYNANAEKRIDNLISDAKIKCGKDLDLASEILKEGLEILDNKFNSHPIDSVEDNCIRIRSKLRIQDKLIQTYIRIIEEGYDPEPQEKILDLKREIELL